MTEKLEFLMSIKNKSDVDALVYKGNKRQMMTFICGHFNPFISYQVSEVN